MTRKKDQQCRVPYCGRHAVRDGFCAECQSTLPESRTGKFPELMLLYFECRIMVARSRFACSSPTPDCSGGMYVRACCDPCALPKSTLELLTTPLASELSARQRPIPGCLLESSSAALSAEMVRARKKFPGRSDLTVALMEEVGELAREMLEGGSRERVRAEALQAACVAMRIYEEGDGSFSRGVT